MWLKKHISWILLGLFLFSAGGHGFNAYMIGDIFLSHQNFVKTCTNKNNHLTTPQDKKHSSSQDTPQSESNTGYCTNAPAFILTGYYFQLTEHFSTTLHRTEYKESSLNLFLHPSSPPPKS